MKSPSASQSITCVEMGRSTMKKSISIGSFGSKSKGTKPSKMAQKKLLNYVVKPGLLRLLHLLVLCLLSRFQGLGIAQHFQSLWLKLM